MSTSAATLQGWAKASKLKEASLNAEGTSLSLGDVALPGGEKATVSFGGKSCEYTLASLFLQILDPEQSLVKYRGACKKHKVVDYVKATDKATVMGFFLGESAGAAPVEQAPAAAAPPPAKEDRKEKERPRESSSSSAHKHQHRKDRDRRDKHRRDKHHHKGPPPKKQRKAIDNEKLFSNLVTVVDKRSKKAQMENDQLIQALSCEGFGVTPDVLAKYKEQSQIIASNEIPVGNSASILKAAAGKDLSRILKLYMDTLHPPKSSKSSSSSSAPNSSNSQKKSWRTYLVGQKPVIIIPKGMTAPITMINAHEFFANSKFVPRDLMAKKGVTARTVPTKFSRRVGARMGGGVVEYELMDNPKVKLRTAKDWERVVAVLAFGAGWQFKDWPGHYSHPVRLFGSVFGFYVGMEGAKVPAELQGWSVVQQKLNRDKRGLDSVTYASFWNGVDEFMAIHKPEMLPQPDA